MRTSLGYIAIALGFLTTISVTAMGNSKPKGAFEIHGHRGARALEPENSIHAFHLAMDKRIDVIEADMVLTKDLAIMLNHDLTINTNLCKSPSITGEKPKVRDLNTAEVKTFDCGSIQDINYPKQKLRPGSRIPTLEELLKLAVQHQKYQKKMKLNLETKLSSQASDQEIQIFVQTLLRKLRNSSFPLTQIIIQSFDFRPLRLIQDKEPKIKISALVGSDFELSSIIDNLKPDYLSPHASHIERSQIKKAQKAGIKVIPWTLNKASHWSHFIGRGVDGIITDDPVGLSDYLKK